MVAATDTGFVRMQVSKVVALQDEDRVCEFVVLDELDGDRHAGRSAAPTGGYSRSASGSAALARPAATARSIVQACPSARPRSNATGSSAARAAASLAGRS
jgi:hypothetical protein